MNDSNHNTITPKLRDYQVKCLTSITEQYKNGIRRQLVSLPTGSGKTVIFAEFPRYFKMKKQMLVLAHRAELLDQAREKIVRANPQLRVEIEQAGRIADPGSHVVVASIPTLGRSGSKRLLRLDPDRFFLIVVDEAHHSIAETYKRVLRHFDVFADDTQKLLVGFTATPKRGDGAGLNQVYQKIVFSRSLPEMIASGFLSPVAGYRVETEVDLSRVRTRMGDFVTSQLSHAVNIQQRNHIIVEVFQTHLKGKQTLCFCVDVAHAHNVAAVFNRKGIKAAAITGDMDHNERITILNDFSAGKIKVLANCMVLTEGYDEPSVEGIILARPTKSSLLYTQMIGRGTRLFPGKKNVTIVDIVDITRKHDLTTLPGLFNFSSNFDLEGHTTDEVQKAIQWVEANRPWVSIEKAVSLSDLRYKCTRIDLFDLKTPPELKRYVKYAWVNFGNGGYRLGLKGKASIHVLPTILGKWEIQLHAGEKEKIIGEESNPFYAIQEAEKYATRYFSKSLALIRLNSRWRNEPATEKQIKILRARKIHVPKGLTKGQASHLIGMMP